MRLDVEASALRQAREAAEAERRRLEGEVEVGGAGIGVSCLLICFA